MDLNKKYNVAMFSTSIRGSKAFAAEQKIRELKKRIFRFKSLEKRLSKKRVKPLEIIQEVVLNMNSLSSAKYKITPDKAEERSLRSEVDRERIHFAWLRKVSSRKVIAKRSEQKLYKRKKFTLRNPLDVREEVFGLAGRLNKKDSPGKFYKSSVENNSYFDKKKTHLITNRKIIDGKYFYWLKSVENEKKLKNRFQRKKIYSSLGNNFRQKNYIYIYMYIYI